MFLLQMWMPWYLWHKFSQLKCQLGIFLLWWVWSVLPCPFLINSGWKSILLYTSMAILAYFLCPFVWKPFSSPFLWLNVYIYCWGMFFVCSKMMDPVFTSILLACVFLLIDWANRWDIIDQWLLILVILMFIVLVCGCLGVLPLFGFCWYRITYFLCFLGWSDPPWTGFFLLVFSVELDLWIDYYLNLAWSQNILFLHVCWFKVLLIRVV